MIQTRPWSVHPPVAAAPRLPRRAKGGIGVAVMLLALVGWAGCGRGQPPAEAPTSLLTQTPIPTPTPTPLPIPTPTLRVDTAGCPTDPDQWRLVEYPKEAGMGNLRGIDPPCVYDQIARTAAWRLLVGMGYSIPEATQIMGFPEPPLADIQTLTVTTHGKTGLVIPVKNWLGELSEFPDLYQWSLNAQNRPADWIVLRGCFRGRDYQLPWRVVCGAWAGDLEAQHEVVVWGEIRSRLEQSKSSRAYPIYFGYAGEGRWLYLGAHTHPDGRLYVLLEDTEEIRRSLPRLSYPLPVGVWDAAWVEKTFGLKMKPLPEGWERWENRSQALVEELARRRAPSGGKGR